MDHLQGLQNLLATQATQIPIVTFLVNLLLAAILSFGLSKFYIRYGNALSNRRRFSSNFMIMAVTTTIIITIVKSSLALSLGLVGALSIVRFRAAIKEPEELAYLFLTIAIGLGLGANQQLITVTGLFVAIAVIRTVSMVNTAREEQNIFLNIVGHHDNPKTIELSVIVDILKKYCSSINLRRFDTSKENFETSFLIDIDNFEKLNQIEKELLKLSDSVRITVMDNKGGIG